MSFDQTEILQLKARIVAVETRLTSLEDLLQNIGRCFLAPPQPKQPEQKPIQISIGVPNELKQYILVAANGDVSLPKRVSNLIWQELNDKLKAQGFKWVSDGAHSRWSHI